MIDHDIRSYLMIARVFNARASVETNLVSYASVAVAVQDTLKYDEPQDWFFPVRESLGGALLIGGDSKGAEQVFRDDLARNPRNPRSLFGLHRALKAQDRGADAWFVEQEYRKAWKGGPTELKVEDLV